MEIKFKKLTPEAKTPFRAIDIDAGFDLYAASCEITSDFIEYRTGIAVEIPEGYTGLIFPRSSVTKYDLILKNSVGVIDASYRGEIRCRFYNTKEIDDAIQLEFEGFTNRVQNIRSENKIYNVGERIAQIVFIEIPKIILIEAEELSNTDRGSGGFGSTGK